MIQLKSIAGEPYINDKKMLYQEGSTQLPSSGGWSHRNLLINGGFDIWQRSENAAGLAGYYTADRWRHRNTVTVEKVYVGFVPHAKLTGNVVNTGIQQRVENGAKYGNKPMTISFDWVYTSGDVSTATFGHKMETQIATSVSIPNPTVSERKTITFTPTGALTVTEYLQIEILLNDGVADLGVIVVSVGNIQLEEGSVATPFEQRPVGYELSLCQRYYQQYGGASYTEFCMVHATSATSIYGAMTLVCPTRLNVEPIWTGDFKALGKFFTGSNFQLGSERGKLGVLGFSITELTGLTGYQSSRLDANNDFTAKLILDAEL